MSFEVFKCTYCDKSKNQCSKCGSLKITLVTKNMLQCRDCDMIGTIKFVPPKVCQVCFSQYKCSKENCMDMRIECKQKCSRKIRYCKEHSNNSEYCANCFINICNFCNLHNYSTQICLECDKRICANCNVSITDDDGEYESSEGEDIYEFTCNKCLEKVPIFYTLKLVDVDLETCLESYPCQHEVKIRNTKGLVVSKDLTGTEIFKLLGTMDKVTKEVYDHFKEYENFTCP